MPKEVKHIVRVIGDVIKLDITGKKSSIIELCRDGKLTPRKCRKYET